MLTTATQQRGMSSVFRFMLKVSLVVVTVALGSLYVFQRKLIYPSGFPDGSRSVVDKPTRYNMKYEDVVLKTRDGVHIKLYVILRPVDEKSAAAKTVVMLGPNAGNMGHSLPIARAFYDMGYNVVTLSYRGYGLSEGSPSEKGLKMDVEAALDYLADHLDIKTTSVVLYGRSLGGAAAIYCAQLPKAKDIIKGVILENTFTSLPQVVPNLFPFLSPIQILVSEKWRSIEAIPNVSSSVPFLFLSGSNDELVPPLHMKQLYNKCPAGKKEFHEFANGTHNDTCIQPKYWNIVQNFLVNAVDPLEEAPSGII